MTYLRSLIARATATRPHVFPIPESPRFAEVQTRFDEESEERLAASVPRRTVEQIGAPAPPPIAGKTPRPSPRASEPPPKDTRSSEQFPPERQPLIERIPAVLRDDVIAPRPPRRRSSRRVTERVRLESALFEPTAPHGETEAPLVAAAASRPYARRAVEPAIARVVHSVDRAPEATARTSADGESSIHVSIGRIDVRANVTPPPKTERLAPFRPRLTLEGFLARRTSG
jgi:hypothetical protein